MKKNMKIMALFIVMICLSLILVSCGSNTASFDRVENGYYDNDYVKEEMEYESSESGSAGGVNATATPVNTTQRKIIYTAWADVQTKEFDTTISNVKALCEKYGAYFESSNSYGNGLAYQSERSARYVIRIPINNYTQFVHEISQIGSIVRSGEENKDITEKYIDTEARLSSAKLREERVLVLLENADKLDDVLALERELSDIRYEIETLTGSLRKYDSLISYATFTLAVEEVVEYTEPIITPKTFGERLMYGFSEGWASFIEFWQNIAIVIAYSFPSLVLLGVIAVMIVGIITLSNRHKKKNEGKTKNASLNNKKEK